MQLDMQRQRSWRCLTCPVEHRSCCLWACWLINTGAAPEWECWMCRDICEWGVCLKHLGGCQLQPWPAEHPSLLWEEMHEACDAQAHIFGL